MKARDWLALAACISAAGTMHGQRPDPVLDTVRVASRSPAPGLSATRTVEVIGRDELAKRAGHDLADVLAASVSLDVFRRSPAQADVAIRGSSFNQIVILVDGVRVSDAQSGHYNLDLAVPMESIERIEILRGGGSTLYGADAIGGAVNIVTRGGARNTVGAHAGTFGTVGGDLALADSIGGTMVRAAADARRSDGHREGTDYRAVQARLEASRHLLAGNFTANAGLGVRNFGAADFYGAYPSYEDTRSARASARYECALGASWRLDASADARRHHDLYTLVRDDPARYQNRHVSWQRGARVVASGRSGAGNTAIGVEGFDASLESARLGDHDERRVAGFTEVSVGSAAHVLGLLGGRVDWSSRTGAFFSPGASIAAAVSPSLQLRASANRGFRAPTWTEAYYSDPANVANPDLRSETFRMAEIGGRITPSWGWMDVALFVRHGDELIDWTKPAADPSAPWRSTNLESATFRGVEVDAGLAELAGIDWRVRASGLRFDSRDADTLVGKYALSPITESASVEGTTTVAGIRLTVVGGRARRAQEHAYWRSDLRASTSRFGWTIRLDALNLGDAEYRDAAAKTAAGRMLLFGVGRAM